MAASRQPAARLIRLQSNHPPSIRAELGGRLLAAFNQSVSFQMLSGLESNHDWFRFQVDAPDFFHAGLDLLFQG